MRSLFIVALLIGMYIAVQSLFIHLNIETMFRSFRDDMTALKSGDNAEKVDAAIAGAFADLTRIKRSFKPIAWSGVMLTVLSIAGLILRYRQTHS